MSADNKAAMEQAKAQLASIVEMVAALGCDYDRLKELKEEKETMQHYYDVADEGEEKTEAAKALLAWRAENGEELQELAEAAGDCENEEEARERIEQDALSVEVRSDWHTPGSDSNEPTEFKILLCTGGPAVQILGDLSQHNEPESCKLMYQDWLTAWEELELTSEERDAVLTYCSVFYFGE
jgi:hypothetical protein